MVFVCINCSRFSAILGARLVFNDRHRQGPFAATKTSPLQSSPGHPVATPEAHSPIRPGKSGSAIQISIYLCSPAAHEFVFAQSEQARRRRMGTLKISAPLHHASERHGIPQIRLGVPKNFDTVPLPEL
jgi:hypothetical protein